MPEIKTDYKYIRFELIEQKPKTKVYAVISKENRFKLGEIRWYGPFRKYSFFPEGNTVYEAICLTNIVEFLTNLEIERKQNL